VWLCVGWSLAGRACGFGGKGPTRAANSAPLGGSEAAKRQAWGNHIPPWVLAAIAVAIAFLIRRQFGYFVGRDPCVAFLFVLLGIKFLEVRTLRDGTLLVCLAIFLLITAFFYNQSLLAGLAALPAGPATGGGLEGLAARDGQPLTARS